jgi:hypothetical protein
MAVFSDADNARAPAMHRTPIPSYALLTRTSTDAKFEKMIFFTPRSAQLTSPGKGQVQDIVGAYERGHYAHVIVIGHNDGFEDSNPSLFPDARAGGSR